MKKYFKGNFVIIGEQIYSVVDTRDDGTYECLPLIETTSPKIAKGDDITPIKLTPQLLIMCGFDFKNDDGDVSHKDYDDDNEYMVFCKYGRHYIATIELKKNRQDDIEYHISFHSKRYNWTGIIESLSDLQYVFDCVGFRLNIVFSNEYLDKMDDECVELCDVMNKMDGVTTTESCCGHCKEPYGIWFKCRDFRSLAILTRSTDRNYSDGKFEIVADSCDVDPLGGFWLRSKTPFVTQEEMMTSVNDLISNIKYWSGPDFLTYFNNSSEE